MKRAFNESKYKYDPSLEGFGTPEDWRETFKTQVLGEKPNSVHMITLGVKPGVTKAELRKAYIKLAMVHHPDKNNNSPESVKKMQQLTEAYDALLKITQA